jgi:hypothetical protein
MQVQPEARAVQHDEQPPRATRGGADGKGGIGGPGQEQDQDEGLGRVRNRREACELQPRGEGVGEAGGESLGGAQDERARRGAGGGGHGVNLPWPS